MLQILRARTTADTNNAVEISLEPDHCDTAENFNTVDIGMVLDHFNMCLQQITTLHSM